MGQPELVNYSISEYLEFELQSVKKHEFDNGEVVAMSGGTINHSILGSNMNAELSFALKASGKRCTAFNSDIKIYIEKANSFVYPDGAVVCGDITTSLIDQHSITSPVLVVEVLSASTRGYDRGEKFRKYCSLPSFCDYVLIEQDQPIVDTLHRAEKGYWKMVTTIGLKKSIYLPSIDATIQMKDIYRNAVDLRTPPFMLDL